MNYTMTPHNIIELLARSWNESGMLSGDTVMVHSALSGFLREFKEEGISLSPNDVLESLIVAAGDKGTLIFPTYNFGFTKGEVFDVRNTPSETGALTECARLHRDSVRTGHPLFSFAVIGHHKEKFRGLENYSAFGIDSPFAKLMQLGGKIAAIDVAGENCMTFYHYVEEMENAPNRYHKIFKGNFVDANGNHSVREFNLYARNLEMNVQTDVKPMEEYLWSKGLFSGSRPGTGSKMHVIDAVTVYREAAKVIREGRSEGMLYYRGEGK
jgi:aminoglycoside 3-N-acetyltransferase